MFLCWHRSPCLSTAGGESAQPGEGYGQGYAVVTAGRSVAASVPVHSVPGPQCKYSVSITPTDVGGMLSFTATDNRFYMCVIYIYIFGWGALRIFRMLRSYPTCCVAIMDRKVRCKRG